MIPISDELKQAFLSTSRYEVEGYFGGLTKIIDNSNILTGGFSLARDLISGNSIEIGTAISAELSINLSNIDHSFEESLPEWLRDDFKPGMTIEFRIKPFGATDSIKLGTFVVDKLEYKRNYITLSALDKMVYLDRIADPAITFVTNLSLLVSNICRLSGVTLANSDEISTFANATVPFPLYTIKAEQGTTYRQLLIYACQLMGVYAYMDWNGELRLSQIPAISSSGVSITKANRVSSDFGASEIALTGIEYVSGDNTEYFSGTTGYVLSMSDNSILEWLSDSLRTTMVNNLATRISSLSGLQYLPFSASIIGQPWLMPGDRVKLVDYNGITRDSFITNMSYRLNGTMTLEAKGTNEETYTLATTGAFTPAQQTVVSRAYVESTTHGSGANDLEYTIKNYSDGSKVAIMSRTLSGMTEEQGSLYYTSPINIDISALGFTEISFVTASFSGKLSGDYQYPNGWIIHGKPTATVIPSVQIVALSCVSSIEYGTLTLRIEGK